MAKPAFIYAFDNLGPERFTEMCGLLLASRYKGFLLGGVGADGGIDGELLGEWRPENLSPLLNEIINPGQLVVFQFKHKVTARIGQANTRAEILKLYSCTKSRTCELHRDLIVTRQPSHYVLVTNAEVNANFRASFITQCQQENASIDRYQVVGLDELESWITMEPEIGHLYFPTIFGAPRFHLRVDSSVRTMVMPGPEGESQSAMVLIVDVLNVGTADSYLDNIRLRFIFDGQSELVGVMNSPNDHLLNRLNPTFGTALVPGRKHTFHYRLSTLAPALKRFAHTWLRKRDIDWSLVTLAEVIATDEIGNSYSSVVSDQTRSIISEFLQV